MTCYSVAVEARSPDGSEVTSEALEAFAEQLAEHHGVVGGNGSRWDARISVDVPAFDLAFPRAEIILAGSGYRASMPHGWPIVAIEVVREDIFEERLAQPSLPDLVSGPEAADILGVSNQRLHQLAATHPEFPQPALRLRAASIWYEAAIRKFGSEWARKPGRPRNPTPEGN
ncbi:MAG TPA: hypothetical protein VFQ44_02090 [Streptosporangiaceae bacterium]|nr:hypothetical protein [Streptosporangiaceae bacterium]